MESNGDNDHQHCKQWPINIHWQVVKCEKSKVGVGRGGLTDCLCLCSHVRVWVCVWVCVHMCESGRNTRCVWVAEKWGGRYLPGDDAVGSTLPWKKQMSPNGQSSEAPQFVLRVLFILLIPLRWGVFFPPALCFIRSFEEVRAGNNWGIQIYAHVFLPFNENSHSLQETAEMKTSIQD